MENMLKLQDQLTRLKKREQEQDIIWEERMREKEIG
jgi:hypothetical protein